MSGLIGAFSVNHQEEVHPYLYQGLMSLQHRGQQGYGFIVGNSKEYGSELFCDAHIDVKKGTYGLGTVKYAFTKEQKKRPLMPYETTEYSYVMDGKVDNHDYMIKLIWDNPSETSKELHRYQGAYSLIMLSETKLLAARDPWGIKPLSIGKHNDTYIVASESCALDAVGATEIRDVMPGEIIEVTHKGIQIFKNQKISLNPCLFEYVYIARQDSIMNGISVYDARKRMGMELYKECPTHADIVLGAPDSGMISALGYAQEAHLPYEKGIVKNRYIGRTFINPNTQQRIKTVNYKLNAIRTVVEGKEIVLIDDSIVRGTTIARTIKILKDNGAKKIHVRVASPQVLYEENLSIDIPDRDKLLCYGKTREEVEAIIGCDSLYFLSIEGIKKACGGGTFYTQYFDGENPFGRKNDV